MPAIPATTATASRCQTPTGATAIRDSTAPTARSMSTSAPPIPASTDTASTTTDPTSKSSSGYHTLQNLCYRVTLVYALIHDHFYSHTTDA